jgi:alanyl-tRNA synthetase
MSVADIRKTFLDFFASKGHAVVESSPLVPGKDPTLMLTNSGMVIMWLL